MKAPLFGFCAAASLIACAGASDSGTGGGLGSGATTSPHDDTHLPPGDVVRGKALTDKNSCAECHGVDYAGSAFYPNITPDSSTGVGAWTDAQIATAIRDGKGTDGAPLCSLMERFPFSDQDTADVVAFLRSLHAVVKLTSDVCPGHGASTN